MLLHFGLANAINLATKDRYLASVFAINEAEARAIAEPAAALMSRYVGTANPEQQLWINLGMALAGAYGGKFVAAMAAKQASTIDGKAAPR